MTNKKLKYAVKFDDICFGHIVLKSIRYFRTKKSAELFIWKYRNSKTVTITGFYENGVAL